MSLISFSPRILSYILFSSSVSIKSEFASSFISSNPSSLTAVTVLKRIREVLSILPILKISPVESIAPFSAETKISSASSIEKDGLAQNSKVMR